ncbi:MAG: pilus assembly protein PilB [Candidatus Muproteobacteria bacterium RIFCSPHIGHO2_01_FULL_65_16]|uniref:Pilus assembly protein PilB n=1 Tax=Candidatus Muproteobacteria bacterium RIFCSPHIGHO2_01_FULL_65_16 TaxID=1817764 RepID=A0A1F6TRV7_9PROT|nr:MAG: pilus assembly protein PilB [Candidatus Muproteobacteria bacterium RIFCSPHIGHO2_01_FULL_65_16]
MTHPFQSRRLGDILVARRFASPEQVSAALAEGEGRLGERLVQANRITTEQLAQALAEQFNLPYQDLNGHAIPSELFNLIPAAFAYQHGAIPYRRDGDVLEVVIADPFDHALADRLERLSGTRVRLLLASRAAIQAVLKRSEGASEALKDVSEDFRLVMVKENDEGKEETVSLEKLGDTTSPVIKLVNTLLLAALQKRASDVHIETYERGIVVKYRIDGVLYPATETLDRRHHSALVSRLKVMAELDIAEKRVPQDGRFKLRFGSRDIDFRISIMPSVFGEDVVIRILDKSSVTEGLKNLRLDGLGMTPEVLKKFRRIIHEPYGMVLITGPTGSGKTTTLYAALSELDVAEEKIITIEDPVEYQLDGIVQIPVNEKKGLTFARGLRSILRHDPDKIMVGEIRDAETAMIAVQSALTGHLVFTTVHANNAFDVIGRFSHMGVDVYSFVSALNCVMAQRLVRQICPQCKRRAAADAVLIELSGLDPKRHQNHVWHEGAGCDHCHGTGYRGRAAITEFLDLSPRIREMIIARRPANELQAAALEEGMVTLRQSAIAKAIAGETSLKEINRVTFVD